MAAQGVAPAVEERRKIEKYTHICCYAGCMRMPRVTSTNSATTRPNTHHRPPHPTVVRRLATVSVWCTLALLPTTIAPHPHEQVSALGARSALPLHDRGGTPDRSPIPHRGATTSEPTAELIDTCDLADSTVVHGTGPAARAPFGGISGIDRVAGDNYIAISDDRSDKGPARAYPLTLPRTPRGGTSTTTIPPPITLTDTTGTPYTPGRVDPESIRVTPQGNLVWSSEGHADAGIAPSITLASPDGHAQRNYTIPDYHYPNAGHGVRNNEAYEAITLIDGGKDAAVLTEGPLQQDTRNRLTIYDTTTGTPWAEYTYQLDPADPGSDKRGASEILTIDDHTFLTLERDYVPGQGTRGKLYRVRIGAASNVLGQATLDDQDVPVDKEELMNFSPHGDNPDNIEGMTWGPNQPDGRRTLLVTTDNNFSGKQRTLVHTIALRTP